MTLTNTDETVLKLMGEVADAAGQMDDPRSALAGTGLEWVLDQVLAGAHLPMNEATVKALGTVHTALVAAG